MPEQRGMKVRMLEHALALDLELRMGPERAIQAR